MKPFNLDEAKAGRPLITRDGRPAKFVAHLTEAIIEERLVVLVKDIVIVKNERGCNQQGFTTGSDLFMAPRKVVKWGRVRLFDGERWGMDTSRLYDTHDEAHVNSDCCRTVRMEFEE